MSGQRLVQCGFVCCKIEGICCGCCGKAPGAGAAKCSTIIDDVRETVVYWVDEKIVACDFRAPAGDKIGYAWFSFRPHGEPVVPLPDGAVQIGSYRVIERVDLPDEGPLTIQQLATPESEALIRSWYEAEVERIWQAVVDMCRGGG